MKNLELWINKNCNLNCSYCHVKDNTFLDMEPDWDALDIVLSRLTKDSSVKILGGEPTLSKYFLKIIERIEKITTKIFVFSNIENIAKNLLSISPDITKLKNVSFILTYHEDQMNITFKDTIKKLYYLESKINIANIIVMWLSSTKDTNLKEFNLLRRLFKKVLLEPTYSTTTTGDFNIQEIEQFDELKLTKYSELLSTKNEILNRTFLEIFKSKDNYKRKICNVDKYWIIYDLSINKEFVCCTDICRYKINPDLKMDIKNIDGIKYCDTPCLLDTEYITKIKE